MKQKFISLALAVMLLLGVTGCAMSTPASVGSIGGVDIPAGIYLLAQYKRLQHRFRRSKACHRRNRQQRESRAES